MTNLEICLIICAVVVPVVALIIVRPKLFKKKQPKQKLVEEAKPEPEIVKEEPVLEKLTPKPEKEISFKEDSLFSTDDFKSYLNIKKEKTSKPKFKPMDFDQTFSFSEFMERKELEKKDKDITFDDLSEDTQAMIIAGVFDKKHFD